LTKYSDYKPGQLPYPEQDDRKKFLAFHYKGVLIFLIPILCIPILFGSEYMAYRMLYLAVVVYLYYIFNVMAQGALAFLFVIFIPLCGISDSKPLCLGYYAETIFITYGSIFMGVMMDVSKLSERLAMLIINIVGSNIRHLQILLMLDTAVFCVVFEATFVAAFWMKIAQAVITEYVNLISNCVSSLLNDLSFHSEPYPSDPAIGIFLTICYSATIGDMASPLQDPNSSIYSIFSTFLPMQSYSFFFFVAPLVFSLAAIALWIHFIFLGLFGGGINEKVNAAIDGSEDLRKALDKKKADMGPWTTHTILAAILILVAAILLALRRPLFTWGWDDEIHLVVCGASVVIIGMGVAYYALPANYLFCRYYCCRNVEPKAAAPSLLSWKAVNANTPWGHIFMLAAGFGFIWGAADSGLFDLIQKTIIRQNFGVTGTLFLTSILGVLLSMVAPATGYVRMTLFSTFKTVRVFRAVAIPYAFSLQNEFLLPCSNGPNTIIAGWGNIRPFQFV
ncbi:hypothetical protein KR222_000346, partial [Zaprionus bogoriensis]